MGEVKRDPPQTLVVGSAALNPHYEPIWYSRASFLGRWPFPIS